MNIKNKPIYLLIIVWITGSCVVVQPDNYKSSFRDINSFYKNKGNVQNEPYFKAHLKSGGLCIYTDTIWTYDDASNTISGNGKLYNAQRDLLKTGVIIMNTDTVLLFESNRKLDNTARNSRLNARTIITAIDATFGVFCIAIPKACWGSCPTFYSGEGDNVFQADAEGFSEAILPSLEYGDIDALFNFKPESQRFSIKMKNEALETHVVRNINILAIEKDPAYKVYHGANDIFYLSDPSKTAKLESALAAEGDITETLFLSDQKERFSLSDPASLKSKEEIMLTFNKNGISEAGLVLNFRQTLMTTYLIYSVMGYMGNTVSDVFAEMEKNNEVLKKYNLIEDELGGIDVYLMKDREEIFCGTFLETGPIATNQQILPLSELPEGEEVRVKLVMNKGLWRIDYAGLVPVLGTTEPVTLQADKLVYKGRTNEEYLEAINNDEKNLVSMPGDEFEFYFTLPDRDAEYDLFLYSKGYYLEWMRESWLHDKDLFRLKLLLENPDRFLRKEAKRYTKYESEMEKIFWSTRIDTEKYDYYE